MGEYGVSLEIRENMENSEKMETSTSWLKTLSFSTRWLKKVFYTASIATTEKIITHVLGEHDYESAHTRPPSHFEPLWWVTQTPGAFNNIMTSDLRLFLKKKLTVGLLKKSPFFLGTLGSQKSAEKYISKVSFWPGILASGLKLIVKNILFLTFII